MGRQGVFESVSRLQELADVMIPTTIRAVSDLGVPDQLADGPRGVVDLAAACGAHAPSLRRALRALSAKEIFVEVDEDVFALTPLAELLRSDHPLSLRNQCRLFPAGVQAWAHIDHTLRTGEPAFQSVHGESLWAYLGSHPTDSARFDDFMAGLTMFEVRAVLAAYDLGSASSVVDVGGGNGRFLVRLLARYPQLRGTVYDLPHVVAAATAVLEGAGVAGRCTVAAGSFFDSVPPGADVYTLKRILYSWGDEPARRLLGSIRDGMHEDSKLLILEPVGGPEHDSRYAKLLDLLMMGIGEGRVRDRNELEKLLGSAGLRLVRIVPTFLFPIVEAAVR